MSKVGDDRRHSGSLCAWTLSRFVPRVASGRSAVRCTGPMRLDQRTGGFVAGLASPYRSGEHTLHPLEIGDLRAHIRKVRRGDVAHLGAGSLASSRELEQRPPLVEGETELSGPAHEAEAPYILLAIVAVATAPERKDRKSTRRNSSH